MTLYSGTDASRIYVGDYRVRFRFTWPDGSPGEAESPWDTYEEAAQLCRLYGAGVPAAVVPATPQEPGRPTRSEYVRIERATIEARS